MKTLTDSTYQALTASQRISAAISADARGDNEEIARLVRTCPRLTFSMTDPEFTDVMNRLVTVSIAREKDIATQCLHLMTHMLGLSREPDGFENHESRCDRMNKIDAIKVDLASSEMAWGMIADELNVPLKELNKATSPRDPIVSRLMEQAAKFGGDDTVAKESFDDYKALIFA